MIIDDAVHHFMDSALKLEGRVGFAAYHIADKTCTSLVGYVIVINFVACRPSDQRKSKSWSASDSDGYFVAFRLVTIFKNSCCHGCNTP